MQYNLELTQAQMRTLDSLLWGRIKELEKDRPECVARQIERVEGIWLKVMDSLQTDLKERKKGKPERKVFPTEEMAERAMTEHGGHNIEQVYLVGKSVGWVVTRYLLLSNDNEFRSDI